MRSVVLFDVVDTDTETDNEKEETNNAVVLVDAARPRYCTSVVARTNSATRTIEEISGNDVGR
jgi:hypothetical protein